MICEHLNDDNVEYPIHKFDDGYAIEGCCGGQCLSIKGIKHCPFCGKLLFKQIKKIE